MVFRHLIRRRSKILENLVLSYKKQKEAKPDPQPKVKPDPKPAPKVKRKWDFPMPGFRRMDE